MKLQDCSKFNMALVLSLVSFSSFSTQIVYGLRQASQLSSNLSRDYYIQVGIFKNKLNALRLKSVLQNKSSHPILLKEKQGYYTVLVGPIHSAAAVRTTAQKLNGSSAAIRVVHTISNTQTRVTRSEPMSVQNKNSGNVTRKAFAVSVHKDKDGFPIPSSNRWFLGLGVGWMSPFGTTATNFASSGMPGFPDDRYSGYGSNGSAQYSALAGFQWRQDTLWLPVYSLSLQYTYTPSARINGSIFVNNLPDSQNFTYQYDISQQIPMAKLKLDLYRWKQLMPYVSVGAGLAFNRAYNYSDSPIPGATLMHRRYGFTSATRTQFAGSVGAGIDYGFNDKVQFGLGYELSYFGKAGTGNGQGVLSANRLHNKFNANAVVLQGIYFFDCL